MFIEWSRSTALAVQEDLFSICACFYSTGMPNKYQLFQTKASPFANVLANLWHFPIILPQISLPGGPRVYPQDLMGFLRLEVPRVHYSACCLEKKKIRDLFFFQHMHFQMHTQVTTNNPRNLRKLLLSERSILHKHTKAQKPLLCN